MSVTEIKQLSNVKKINHDSWLTINPIIPKQRKRCLVIELKILSILLQLQLVTLLWFTTTATNVNANQLVNPSRVPTPLVPKYPTCASPVVIVPQV
jgi:hypothetical protein